MYRSEDFEPQIDPQPSFLKEIAVLACFFIFALAVGSL